MIEHVGPVTDSETRSPGEVESARRERARWAQVGFGLGIVSGFIATAAQIAVGGWRVLPHQLVWNLIWAPAIGAEVGFGVCPACRKAPWSWRNFRLSTRTLMLAITYVALLLGLGVSTAPIGRAAGRYYSRHITSTELSRVYGKIAAQSELEAGQKHESVPLLRAGKIPETLTHGQKEFLRTLDRTASPEYRSYRYGLIADAEESHGKRQARNVVVLRTLIEYHDAMAAKYDRAQWRPWLPVAPDPPMPATE